MATTYLKKTFDGAEASSKGTISFWMKRSKLGAEQMLYINTVYNSSWQSYGQIRINSDDTLRVRSVNSGSSTVHKITTMKFRDTNAWYHIVVTLDYDNASSSNYQKIYVNGDEVTEFTTNSNPSSTNNFFIGSDLNGQRIGSADSTQYFDGSLSHYHCVVGTVYTPSTFGETDSTTGEWKIKTNPGISTANYGAGGFFILKDGNSVTDQSGNGNNFTVGGGTLTKTEDNPSNVFATMNPLNVPTSNLPTFSNGNTTTVTSTSGSGKWGGSTTLGMTSGKFYCEAKATIDASYSRSVIGITGDSANMARGNGSPLGSDQTSSGFYSETGRVAWNTVTQYTAGAYVTGDIIQIALDLDNNRLFYGKNGTWLNSGNPTSSTGAVTITGADTTNDGAYFFCQADDTGTSSVSKFDFNFGNGYFGTTAVSSAGTNASGNGIFEYDCPAGFTALSTKGLNL